MQKIIEKKWRKNGIRLKGINMGVGTTGYFTFCIKLAVVHRHGNFPRFLHASEISDL